MNPISYSYHNGEYTFQYDAEEYNQWKAQGEKTGDVGPILYKLIQEHKIYVYHSFGTFEHPVKEMHTISMKHSDAFEGEWKPPDWYLKGVADKRQADYWKNMFSSMKMVILDVSGDFTQSKIIQ